VTKFKFFDHEIDIEMDRMKATTSMLNMEYGKHMSWMSDNV